MLTTPYYKLKGVYLYVILPIYNLEYLSCITYVICVQM